jgi:hypothetical protein
MCDVPIEMRAARTFLASSLLRTSRRSDVAMSSSSAGQLEVRFVPVQGKLILAVPCDSDPGEGGLVSLMGIIGGKISLPMGG